MQVGLSAGEVPLEVLDRVELHVLGAGGAGELGGVGVLAATLPSQVRISSRPWWVRPSSVTTASGAKVAMAVSASRAWCAVRNVLITVGSSFHDAEMPSLRWLVLMTPPSGLPRREGQAGRGRVA